ncbi:MAG TPA: RNA polymerase sigma factor [Acidimicrobiales bacterium]|nr:RNA polymerase sigma factor [Acidimicrobiales bacterium]
MTDRPDDADVESALAGDTGALDRLLRAHYDRLFAVCRRLTGNDADAADACQEALIAIVRNLHKFDRRSRFGTWAYRIAVNASLDELRRRRRRPATSELGRVDRDRLPYRPDGAADVVDRLALDAALAALSPEFRAAVVLRDVAGLDYAEIAQALDIPPGTVRSRIARGRAALADTLREPTRPRRTSKEQQ